MPRFQLEQLDPRLKLVLLLALVMLTFAADSVWRLLLLSLVAIWFSLIQGEFLGFWWRIIRPMRVLLLVTLVMHLCFSSGWTLFGQTWLSLDGLQLGLLTCWRLIVAVTFAVLLTRSSKPSDLAAALGYFLVPLRRIGVKSEVLVEFLVLSLSFIPRFQQRAAAMFSGEGSSEAASRIGRLKLAVNRIEPLLLEFADTADALALQMANGEQVVEIPVLTPLQGAKLWSWGGGALLLLLLLWLL